MLAYYFSLYIPCNAIINDILKSQTMWEMLNIHPIFLHMFYECSTCDQERFFKHVHAARAFLLITPNDSNKLSIDSRSTLGISCCA